MIQPDTHLASELELSSESESDEESGYAFRTNVDMNATRENPPSDSESSDEANAGT